MCIREEGEEEIYMNIANVIIKCVIPRYLVGDLASDYGFFFCDTVCGRDFSVSVKKDISDETKAKKSFDTKMNNKCYIDEYELIVWGSFVTGSSFYLSEFRKYFISFLTWILLRKKNMFLLHSSSALVNGKCILFAGNSGAGKTTMEMTMVKNGATYISNDLTFIYVENNRVKVLGIPQKITMTKETYDYCGLDYKYIKGEKRIYIDPKGQIDTKAGAELDAIVLLTKDINSKNAMLEKGNFFDAVARLLPKVIYSYKWGFKPKCEEPPFFSALNVLMRHIEETTPVYYLVWGQNPTANYDAVMKEILDTEETEMK